MTNYDEFTIRQIHTKRAQIKSLEAEVKDLIASLAVDSEGKEAVGDFIVATRPTVRFDAATAKQNLSAAKFKSICEMVPTSKRAKEMLGDIDYAKTQKTSGWTVSVDLPKED